MSNTQQISFAKLTDESWGIRVHGPGANRLTPGASLRVQKRNGKWSTVVIGSREMTANGGKTAWYRLEKQATYDTRRAERTRANIERATQAKTWADMSVEDLQRSIDGLEAALADARATLATKTGEIVGDYYPQVV